VLIYLLKHIYRANDVTDALALFSVCAEEDKCYKGICLLLSETLFFTSVYSTGSSAIVSESVQ